MTNEMQSGIPSPGRRDIHYSDVTMQRTMCQRAIYAMAELSSDWSEVTCGECRLEMPMQRVPGQVEYRVPADIKVRDRELGHQDEIRALHSSLAAVEATYACLSESIGALRERLGEARAERQDIIRRLRALESAVQGSGVPTEGVAASEAAESLSADRYRVLQGCGAGREGRMVRRGLHAAFWIVLDGETQERYYEARCVEKIS